MNKGCIIVIEGTDCSGKETQTKLLVEKLKESGKKVFLMSFPVYESPTGKIVGGPLLGKSYISEGFFKELAPNVDPLVASCYYAADRRYHLEALKEHMAKDEILILDRYVISNMAHQGSKIKEKKERLRLYEKLEMLEYEIMELPRPNLVFFLYMPYQYGEILRNSRAQKEELDQNEQDKNHLLQAEKTYLELAKLYHFTTINCVEEKEVRTRKSIQEELYSHVEDYLKLKKVK